MKEIRCSGSTRDTAEYHTAEQRGTTKTVGTVDTTRNLTSGEETRDGLARLVDDPRLSVDLETTHSVVQHRGHEGNVEVVIELPLAVGEELSNNA